MSCLQLYVPALSLVKFQWAAYLNIAIARNEFHLQEISDC